MATIHPSRLGLVPQDRQPPIVDAHRSHSPSPRPANRNGQSRNRDRDNAGRPDWGDSGRRDRDRVRRDRARADDYFDVGRGGDGGRDRSRSIDRKRDRERTERRDNDAPRRPSPEYSEYRRPLSPHGESTSAPWRQQENMYPNRRDRGPQGSYGGGDYTESRRQQREANVFSIWPPSPKGPARTSSSPDHGRHKHSKKRHRHESAPSSPDSEERRGSERRHKHRREKDRENEDKSRRHHRKSRSVSLRHASDGEGEHNGRRRSRSRADSEERLSRKPRHSSRTRSPEERPPLSGDEDDWIEKPTAPTLLAPTSVSKELGGPDAAASPPLPTTSSRATGNKATAAEEESDEEVGPQPLPKATSASKRVDERQYGGALLRGEGSAMAAFLKDGTDIRIPRRGEIGLHSDEIAAYESVGYVMSGSRHKRMNAVRMRKENQVISAEEKRGILKLQQEERARREAILREEFEELVKDNLKAQGAGP